MTNEIKDTTGKYTIRKENKMNKINFNRVKELVENNHVVAIYPRKNMVCVDGYAYFKVNKADVSKIKSLKK